MQCRFDKFDLDTEQLCISADGRQLDAESRQLQLLSLLIDAYPEHCDQAFLLQKLWTSTVVSHWSLGRLVSDTRKFFRRQGYEKPLIQTLHGRGYRLAPELAEQLQRLPTAPPRKGARFPGWRVSIAALLLLLAVQMAYLFAGRPAEQNPDSRLVIGEAPDVRGRVLWVDDNPDNNLAERHFLEANHIAVYTATNTEDALTLLTMYDYDAVISDMGRGGEALAGFKLIERMRDGRDRTPFFLYTIMPSAAQRALLNERGGQGVAVTSEELYGLLLPLFDIDPHQSSAH